MGGKVFFVLAIFILILIAFAGGSIGEADLTNGGQTQTLGGSSSSGGEVNPDVFAGGSSSSASAADQPGTAKSSSAKNGPCGSTYTVKSGDTLSKIAKACGVTLKELLAGNPSITNQNLIKVGQKITIHKEAPTAKATAAKKAVAGKEATTKASPTPIPGVKPGDTVTVEVKGFPPNADVQVGIGKVGASSTVVQKGKTDANGAYKAAVKVPKTAKAKEKWVVTIVTVNRPKMTVTSEPFTIGSK